MTTWPPIGPVPPAAGTSASGARLGTFTAVAGSAATVSAVSTAWFAVGAGIVPRGAQADAEHDASPEGAHQHQNTVQDSPTQKAIGGDQ